MNFDRNTVIGFVVLALLFFGYFYFTNKEQKEQAIYKNEQLAKEDSIRKANQVNTDTAIIKKDSAIADSVGKVAKAGHFKDAINGNEEIDPVSPCVVLPA